MTWVIAHRGASAYEVENSMAAFSTAVRMGADGVELDVHTTLDGIAVVHHDAIAGTRCIAESRFEQLRDHKLSNGESIPPLVDVLSTLGTACHVFVEVKHLPRDHDGDLLKALEGGPATDLYHVHSFDHRIVRRLKQANPELTCGVLSVSYQVNPYFQVHDAGALELWQVESMVDRDLIAGARDRGYRVYAWTVDDPDRMRHLVEMGVDAICTNRPDVARGVVG
ncbi:MAG: glycerophosphodiester phosphodiesterase [Gemmatimonadota bacterium]|nr:MAG: glycerophosphodiester phosphodiesterase [Gemmatimonadota bacterium]